MENENNLTQHLEQQSQKIRQLEEKLESHDQALEYLLENVDISETATTSKKHSSEKSRSKLNKKTLDLPKTQKKPSPKTFVNTPSIKSKIPQQVNKKTTTPSPRKQNQHQLLITDIPKGFQPTKRAFYEHIKMLWGLIYRQPVPISPDYSMLKEFNTRFSFLPEIEAHVQNLTLPPLVPLSEILTLRNMEPGMKKLGSSIIHMSDFAIKYIISVLANLGIRRWAPDLNNMSDTLYNEACRISAIQTFRQISIGGAYEFMNFNISYLEDIQLLTKVYNHYVHYHMAQRYKKEAIQSGKHARDEERKAILRARLKLKNLWYKFGVAQGFPQRYLKILSNTEAHSDDELDPQTNKYMIKTLECRSEKANQFFRRVDEEIEKADNAQKKRPQRRQRHIPGKGMASISRYVPKGLPIDFYDPKWFNRCTAGQKRSADAFKIAFLPDASKSLLGNQYTDERLSDKRFTEKYWEKAIEPYDITHELANDEDLDVSVTEESDELEYLAEEDLGEESEDDEVGNKRYVEVSHCSDKDTEMVDVSINQQVESSFFNFPNEWAS
ncbi:hypothetical protein O181_013450 [Austropuccinia psidii MF-1]|uniref:Uncharacterized protein n=1 Tax=Austropuccinia psidii MF-1 TaxID=1389203 RepID=A0A9Q3BZ14_9BASI|nr:hypothetical protein [Austropuccinia psidii MF-1]